MSRTILSRRTVVTTLFAASLVVAAPAEAATVGFYGRGYAAGGY